MVLGDIANLGLTLAERKLPLAGVQQGVVAARKPTATRHYDRIAGPAAGDAM